MKRLSNKALNATKGRRAGYEILVPKPMPHQLRLLRDPHRHKTAVCGRRWGKTGAGLPAVVYGHGDEDPSSRHHLKGAVDGGTIWWIAPTFGITRKIERDLIHSFQASGLEYHKTHRRIELRGGGSITLKTAASPTSLRGDGLDGIVYDEAAFAPEDSWREALRPALADKQGWSLFLTSPNGPNWVKDRFDRGGLDPQFKSWQCPSSDNPLMTPDEIDALRREIGDRAFQQEVLARFVQTEGSEFCGAYFLNPNFWYDEEPSEREVCLRVMGLDPSKGKDDKCDYTALVLAKLTRDGHVYIDADIERRDLATIASTTVDQAVHFQPCGIVIETNQFQELLVTQLRSIVRQRGIEMFPVHECNHTTNKITRIRGTLTPFLARGELHFKRGSFGSGRLVQQLKEFPTGRYDDGPDALEMTIRLLSHLNNGGGPSR